jgi:hypothetical protein
MFTKMENSILEEMKVTGTTAVRMQAREGLSIVLKMPFVICD